MKTILTFTIIALSITCIMAQGRKPGMQPGHKTLKHKAMAKTKKSVEPDEAQQDNSNFEVPRNQKLKPNTDLINVPEKK